MKNTRYPFIPGCFCSLIMILLLQPDIEAQEFQINRKDQITSVSSADLNFACGGLEISDFKMRA